MMKFKNWEEKSYDRLKNLILKMKPKARVEKYRNLEPE
jgi:hypothetical protein